MVDVSMAPHTLGTGKPTTSRCRHVAVADLLHLACRLPLENEVYPCLEGQGSLLETRPISVIQAITALEHS